MTPLSKDQTELTPALFSGESTGEKGQPSSLSADTDNTPTSTPPTPKQSPVTSPADNTDNSQPTTPRTTPKITEASRQHAQIGKAALLQLEKAGLIKRYKVLSIDPTTQKPVIDPTTGKPKIKEIRIVFDPAMWSENLDLK